MRIFHCAELFECSSLSLANIFKQIRNFCRTRHKRFFLGALTVGKCPFVLRARAVINLPKMIRAASICNYPRLFISSGICDGSANDRTLSAVDGASFYTGVLLGNSCIAD